MDELHHRDRLRDIGFRAQSTNPLFVSGPGISGHRHDRHLRKIRITFQRGDQVVINGKARHVASYMKDFLFQPEQARTPIRNLSGGERARLMLARIMAKSSNLLILDEPTNDLDIETLDLLEELLADHPGTLLLVSHDRDFIDRLVTSTIVFDAPGRVREYAGGYSDWLRQRPAAPATPSAKTEAAAARPRPEPRSPAFPAKLQRELDRLPERIAAIGGEHDREPDLVPWPLALPLRAFQVARHRPDIHHRRKSWKCGKIPPRGAMSTGVARGGSYRPACRFEDTC